MLITLIIQLTKRSTIQCGYSEMIEESINENQEFFASATVKNLLLRGVPSSYNNIYRSIVNGP